MIIGLLTRRKVKKRADAIDMQARVVQEHLHAISRMRHYTPEEWKPIGDARKALVDLRILLGPMRDGRITWRDDV
jgi:hypothetical protein